MMAKNEQQKISSMFPNFCVYKFNIRIPRQLFDHFYVILFSVASASFRAGYVIGGEDAEITDWPFMVSVQTQGQFHFCGGVLFDSTHVLTAAHCVEGDYP